MRPSTVRRASACLLAFCALAALPASAADDFAPDRPEPGSVEGIARFVTEPRFSNPWVSYVPDSRTVTSPTKYLGHVVGAAGELSTVAKIHGYFRELARTSPRVRVMTIGRSDEGRDIILVAVSDEASIRDLDRLKAASAALADPRTTDPDRAEAVIASAKPFYFLNAGLHSQETGSPEAMMELAFRLAVSERPLVRDIRRNVVVLINPVSEPDGRDRFVEWFYRHLKGKTDYDRLPPVSPPYWGKYVFHDNNRDTHQAALETTRAVHRAFFEFHPVVLHDLHESVPLLLSWNGTGPFNPYLDPIAVSEMFDIAFAEVRALTALGMPGVWTWDFGEGYGQHYLEGVANNHNAVGRGYETFGNGTAETVDRDLGARRWGRPATSREWFRPLPAPKRFKWSLRNNVNYTQTGVLAALEYTALRSKGMLRDMYRKARASWQKGLTEKPRAFLIPADQGDRRRVAEMVGLLVGQRIEVGRATADLEVQEGKFPAGTYVVRMDQPYRNYALDLLAPQAYPKDGTTQTYDDVSWAFPVHFGLAATAVDDEAVMGLKLEPVTEEPATRGRVLGSGPVFLLKDSGQESLLQARARLGDARVEIAEAPFKAGGIEYPAGSWILGPSEGLAAGLDRLAATLGLDFESAGSAPDVVRHDATLPRIALWHPWTDTQMIGWVRLVLDRQGVPYALLRDDDIRAGGLGAKFDVIIHGDSGEDLKGQIHGIDRKFSPLPYTKTPEFPTHGFPAASEDITGGIGWAGMAELQGFVDGGGTLITLGGGSALALDGGLAAGVERVRGDGNVWTPGVELVASFARSGHFLAYGYGARTSVFRDALPVYGLRKTDGGLAVLRWGTRPPAEEREEAEAKPSAEGQDKPVPMLVSGGLKGEETLEGRPAILDIPVGQGRILAYNFNPVHRMLNRSDHRLLWNALLNWKVRPEAKP